MKRGLIILAIVALVVPIVLTACAAPQPSLTAADFYRVNKVTVAVPSTAGGGTDYFGRLLASYWPMVVEDGTAVVKNVTGAAAITGINYTWKAEPDGLTVGVASPDQVTGPVIFDLPGVEFELGKFNWIGSMVEDEYAIGVGTASSIETLEELKEAEGLTFGATTLGSASAQSAAFAISALGLKNARIITGYDGWHEIALAAGKGELDGMIHDGPGFREYVAKEWLKPPLVFINPIRSPWYPDVPTIAEVAEIPPELERFFTILEAFRGRYLVFTTPGVPMDRVQFLRDRFAEITKLKPFLRHLKLRVPIFPEPLTGDEVAALQMKFEAITGEDIEAFEQLIRSYVP